MGNRLRRSCADISKLLCLALVSKSISLVHGQSCDKRVYVMADAVGRDTVSSVGIIKGPTLPETTTGMTHVCAFRHALALDEVRVKFLPEYVNGGEGPTNKHGKATGNVKEVWFAGSHSDM
jgi:uncharacterized protein (DUF2235 family)